MLRQALYGLDAIAEELFPGRRPRRLRDTMEAVMLDAPRNWDRYYHGSEAEQALQRHFSYSDRIRYYWPHPAIQAAQAQLLANLERTTPPLTLLSQYLPAQYEAVRAGRVRNLPVDLLKEGVAKVLRQYMDACAGAAIKELETC